MASPLAEIAARLIQERGAARPDRSALLSYLREAPVAEKDLWPGDVPRRMGRPYPLDVHRQAFGLSDPVLGETWYRGGQHRLRLGDGASFFTRDPQGAAWYAIENRHEAGKPNALGAVGHYTIDATRPARLRDVLEMVTEEPALLRDMEKYAPYDGTENLLDVMYSPLARQELRARGFDSALMSDVLERGEIPALVPVDVGQVSPFGRRLVTFAGERRRIPERFREPVAAGSSYDWVGPLHSFMRKARGGLASLR